MPDFLEVFTVSAFHLFIFYFFPSAEELRPKSGKTMVACAAAGGKQVLLKRGNVGAKRMRETFAYQVLPDFAGQRP
ncbi:MAG TPA: hypothetical protein VK668_18600 [Mucilaginibacter sp.]|nr:hypothetical protein [Mucilaginibacter sp.]